MTSDLICAILAHIILANEARNAFYQLMELEGDLRLSEGFILYTKSTDFSTPWKN